MNYAHDTALLCLLGWLAHWLASWMEAWKAERVSLVAFVERNPPAFYFSLIVTVSAYLMGPSVITASGFQLPAATDDNGLKLVVAFLAGWFADSLVYKLATLTKRG